MSAYPLDNHFHKGHGGMSAGISATESSPSLGGPLHQLRQEKPIARRNTAGIKPQPITTKRLGP